ncbi:MAG: DNA repair ATPase [Planctomycetaceae bacterium]
MSTPSLPADAPMQLEGGTYEILQNRLRGHGEELRRRLDELNQDRKHVFGSIDLKLLTTERITTEHNCIPRDMVSIGSRFLFGYNVHFGLKAERNVNDVFACYEFDAAAQRLQPTGLDLLGNAQFQKDFQDVYRYYKNATFAKFFSRGPHLYMVFQVGKSTSDIKSFKWAIEGDTLRYLDNRSDHEVKFPSQHEFEWKRTTRDMYHFGTHPHVSIEDRIFVETVGGDLTIKVENNTDSGEGIYAEPVDNADQTLDDGDIQYAIVGHVILLKIRPYQERDYRYIVFNEKLKRAQRIDSLKDACVLLPDDHGLIFSNGYYLQTGEAKTFDTAIQGLIFERRVVAPNGEDTLYVFYQPETGAYVLLGYNLIAQRVDTPVICHGFTMFRAGEMLLFKGANDPQKHHAVQIWQTPYVGNDYVPEQTTDSYLYKIGNRDIVRGMAECHAILGLIEKDDSYAGLYLDIVKQSTDVLDSYFWIREPQAANLGEPLSQVRDAARAAVDEFEKVVRVRANTAEQSKKVAARTRELIHEVGRQQFNHIDPFVKSLASLRSIRGDIIALRDLRYIDPILVDTLEKEATRTTEQLSQRCVEFLLKPNSLAAYEEKIATEQSQIDGLQKVSDAKRLDEKIADAAGELEMLIEIVSNLKIDDATQRTTIIDNISAIFSHVNAARAALKRKRQSLASVEGSAEFASQLKLLNQSVVNYLDVCDTPEKTEEFLTKLMVQVEELEGKFAEFDDFIIQLAEKREEVASAFETRRMQLVERRNKRANALAQAADRILKGIKSRVDSLPTINDIHGYFASDLMIEKVRDIVSQLETLGDSVKVDDIQSRLKTAREDAVRQLKDKQELYEGGDHVIRFGKHRFSVNTQTLDLTTVLREDRLHLHLTGTDFYEPIHSDALASTRPVWEMEVVSENRDVYRAEYLAWKLFSTPQALGLPTTETNRQSPAKQQTADKQPTPDQLSANRLSAVQQFMAPRYTEGYTKGVHDHDAAILLAALTEINSTCGLLRYSSSSRALAGYLWNHVIDDAIRVRLANKLTGYATIGHLFPDSKQEAAYIDELVAVLQASAAPLQPSTQRQRNEHNNGSGHDDSTQVITDESRREAAVIREAAEYLFYELTSDAHESRGGEFVVSQQAANLYREFHENLHSLRASDRLQKSLDGVRTDSLAALALAKNWVTAYVRQSLQSAPPTATTHQETQTLDVIDEVALLLMETALSNSNAATQPASFDQRRIVAADTVRQLTGLTGSHPVIGENGTYQLDFNRFRNKLARFDREVVPAFQQYHEIKSKVVESAREEMKLAEFQPRVLSSFVRNQLIDKVYLPLIGDNLAKQIGTSGNTKRTDRQGLLLLISPPGYGKTTLMEYIANRLGIIFMKINGPALGHHVTSLDPNAAPNAGAREEIEKLNLAFEMGDNVMIYLDDIQHCHPEFLQKFISLCDAQRKVEGVYKGKSRTYDFRGKKVAVVMAGNPYTESGEKFQIPDMLANRADIYNLGEIIGDSRDPFEMSYLENALTSNPLLAKLAARSQQDVYGIIKIADKARRQTVSGPNSSSPLDTSGVELEGTYALEELNEFVSTMTKLMRVRDVVLRVNQEYIASAAQHDDYRTEPPFLLQGSYRNMNRIAEKVLPAMNEAELETLIVSSYQNDAQTLTSGTEANMLKFKELIDRQTPEEQERWETIRRTYRQNVKMRGIGSEDKVGQVIASLTTLSDGLDAIRKAVTQGAGSLSTRPEHATGDDRVAAATTIVSSELAQLRTQLERGLTTLTELAQRPISIDVPEIRIPEISLPELLTDSLTQLASSPQPSRESSPTTTPKSAAASHRDDRTPRILDESDFLPAPPAPTTTPAQITVINRLPKTVYNVLEQQFNLMHGWLKPLTEMSRQQKQDFADLRPMVEECLRHYRTLLRKLEEAHDNDEG